MEWAKRETDEECRAELLEYAERFKDNPGGTRVMTALWTPGELADEPIKKRRGRKKKVRG